MPDVRATPRPYVRRVLAARPRSKQGSGVALVTQRVNQQLVKSSREISASLSNISSSAGLPGSGDAA